MKVQTHLGLQRNLRNAFLHAQGVGSLEKLQQQALLCGLTQGTTTAALTLPLPPALAGVDGIQLAAVSCCCRQHHCRHHACRHLRTALCTLIVLTLPQ
jgi:hypothetical protein